MRLFLFFLFFSYNFLAAQESQISYQIFVKCKQFGGKDFPNCLIVYQEQGKARPDTLIGDYKGEKVIKSKKGNHKVEVMKKDGTCIDGPQVAYLAQDSPTEDLTFKLSCGTSAWYNPSISRNLFTVTDALSYFGYKSNYSLTEIASNNLVVSFVDQVNSNGGELSINDVGDQIQSLLSLYEKLNIENVLYAKIPKKLKKRSRDSNIPQDLYEENLPFVCTQALLSLAADSTSKDESPQSLMREFINQKELIYKEQITSQEK